MREPSPDQSYRTGILGFGEHQSTLYVDKQQYRSFNNKSRLSTLESYESDKCMPKQLKQQQTQELSQSLGRAIARRRKECGYTQDELAGMVNVDTETISRFERGAVMPSLERLDKVAIALEVGLVDLLGQASKRHSDQARRLVELMAALSAADRTLLISFAEQMVEQKRP